MMQEQLRKNIAKLLQDRGLTQKELSYILDIDASQVSRIMNGSGSLTLGHIEKISSELELRPIDLFTYPDIYQKPADENEPADVLLQLKLSKEKKDQVLKLVFGENNIEIFNK